MKMVRKSLLAAAAGVLISPALMAADLDGPSVERTFGNEFLSTAAPTDIVAGDILAVTLGAEYAVDDIITLSFSGGALDATTVPTSVTVVDGALSGITLGLLSATADTAVLRVTEIVPGIANSTVGVVVTFAAADILEFNADAVDAANGVTVSFNAETGTGLALDTSGGDDRSHDYLLTDDQFSAEVTTPFDQTVDVNQNREGFEDLNCCDLAEVDLTDTPPAGGSVAFVDQDVMWSGDFSWIIDTDEVAGDIQPIADVVTVDLGCTDLVVTATDISYTCPFSGTTSLELDPSLNDSGDGLAILPATSYTVTVAANFTGFSGAAGTTSFTVDAGAWVLNGFQAQLSYTPFGPNIGQVIYLANRGSQAGDVTVDYVAQDGTSGSLGVVGTLLPTSTLSIGPTIRNLLPQALQDFGRIALTITANVPSCDAQVNAQYNASGNRAYTSARDNCDEWPGSF